jgi:DUF1680 family protein
MLEQITDFPISEQTTLILKLENLSFTIKLRIGYWMHQGIKVKINKNTFQLI